MVTKFLVITGDITFQENPNIATVNTIDNACLVNDAETAAALGESLLGDDNGYLIPQLYNGTINWKQ